MVNVFIISNKCFEVIIIYLDIYCLCDMDKFYISDLFKEASYYILTMFYNIWQMLRGVFYTYV